MSRDGLELPLHLRPCQFNLGNQRNRWIALVRFNQSQTIFPKFSFDSIRSMRLTDFGQLVDPINYGLTVRQPVGELRPVQSLRCRCLFLIGSGSQDSSTQSQSLCKHHSEIESRLIAGRRSHQHHATFVC